MTDEELIERLRAFADIEDGGGTCDLQIQVSPCREAAARIQSLEAQLAVMREALKTIESLPGTDSESEQMQCIARTALRSAAMDADLQRNAPSVESSPAGSTSVEGES